jgi:hypothetical protein
MERFASMAAPVVQRYAAALSWLNLPGASARRKAITLSLISLVAWSAWNGIRRFEHPWGDLSKGAFTDHFSHMNAARAFARIGQDLWTKPYSEIFQALTEDELKRMPADVRAGGSSTGSVLLVPGWPEQKPLATNWVQRPRPYPPGVLLLVAPVSVLYHFTPLSLTGACRILIGLFIVLTHVAFYWLLLAYFEGSRSGIEWLGLFFIYSYLMRWTLDGFYDSAAILPLVLCARYLGQRRGLAALVAYCIAGFLHFRVFFLAPWVMYAVYLFLTQKEWQGATRRNIAALIVAGVLAAASLYVFAMGWPAMREYGVNNPLRLFTPTLNGPMAFNFVVLLVVCGVGLLWTRAWLDLAMLGWLGLVFFSVRELWWWHFMIPITWIGAPAPRDLVRGIRIAFLASLAALVVRETFALVWLGQL